MSKYTSADIGLDSPSEIYANLNPSLLVEHVIRRGEGKLSDRGAVVVTTGKYTGRSPDDKFIVDTPGVHDKIDWGSVNRPVSRESFDALKKRVIEYFNGKEVYVFDGIAGADGDSRPAAFRRSAAGCVLRVRDGREPGGAPRGKNLQSFGR